MNFDNNDKNLKAFFQKSLGDTNPKRELTHKKEIYSQILVTNPEPTRIQYWLYKFLNIFNMDKQVILKGLVTLLALGGTTTGTVVVADKAAPGDALYGVDRAIEKIQEAVAITPETKAKLANSLLEERMKEVQKTTENPQKYGAKNIERAVENMQAQEEVVEKIAQKHNNIEEKVEKQLEENLARAKELQEKAQEHREKAKERMEKAEERNNKEKPSKPNSHMQNQEEHREEKMEDKENEMENKEQKEQQKEQDMEQKERKEQKMENKEQNMQNRMNF